MRQFNNSFLVLTCWCLALLLPLGCAQRSTSAAGAFPAENKKASETVVYLVRHAEKETNNPQNQDPDLTPGGRQRAQALHTVLQAVNIKALYATNYNRTQQTLLPLAEAKKLEVHLYQASDVAGLAQTIQNMHAGQTVLVAAHSNTVLELVEALGAKRPFPAVADHEYDYLLKVTLKEKGTPQVEVRKYGATSAVPQERQ